MPFTFDEAGLKAKLKSAIDAYDPEEDPDSRAAFANIISAAVAESIQPLLVQLNTHTHTSSSPGSPTGPAIVT